MSYQDYSSCSDADQDKFAAIAKKWLDDDPLILDTETTGLYNDAEIVEISIVDKNGWPALDTLIKPQSPIPANATEIHHITNDMVKDAPGWADVHDEFCKLTKDRRLVVYNLDYDRRLLQQTIQLQSSKGALSPWHHPEKMLSCAMLLFAPYYGEWDEYRESWKRQKLVNAARYMEVKIDGQAHRALTDCLMTLGVLRGMANSLPESAERQNAGV